MWFVALLFRGILGADWSLSHIVFNAKMTYELHQYAGHNFTNKVKGFILSLWRKGGWAGESVRMPLALLSARLCFPEDLYFRKMFLPGVGPFLFWEQDQSSESLHGRSRGVGAHWIYSCACWPGASALWGSSMDRLIDGPGNDTSKDKHYLLDSFLCPLCLPSISVIEVKGVSVYSALGTV